LVKEQSAECNPISHWLMDSDYVNDRRTKEVMILLMLNRENKVV